MTARQTDPIAALLHHNTQLYIGTEVCGVAAKVVAVVAVVVVVVKRKEIWFAFTRAWCGAFPGERRMASLGLWTCGPRNRSLVASGVRCGQRAGKAPTLTGCNEIRGCVVAAVQKMSFTVDAHGGAVVALEVRKDAERMLVVMGGGGFLRVLDGTNGVPWHAGAGSVARSSRSCSFRWAAPR